MVKLQSSGDIESVSLADILKGAEELGGYLRISLYEGCNERCFFCHNEGAETRTELVDTRIMWTAIKASMELGKLKFKFTGGEPTLHPKLTEYISRIKQINPNTKVGIVTNGTLLYEIGQDLMSAGLDSLVVSLHSLDRENYKKITGLDALDKVLDGLSILNKQGLKKMTINMAVSEYNVQEVENMKRFADEKGYSLRLLDILPKNSNLEQYGISQDELKTRFSDITIKKKCYYEKCKECKDIQRCGEGEYLRLAAKGVLHPCMYRNDLEIPLNLTDSYETTLKKVALGFRRIKQDDL